MKRGRHDDPPGGQLDDAGVVHDVVAGVRGHADRVAQRRELVGRSPHVEIAVVPRVLAEIEQQHVAVPEPQEADGHRVVLALVFHEDAIVGPRLAAIVRRPGRDIRLRVVMGPAREARIDEAKPTVLQFDDVALGVPRVLFRRIDGEEGLHGLRPSAHTKQCRYHQQCHCLSSDHRVGSCATFVRSAGVSCAHPGGLSMYSYPCFQGACRGSGY
jgi:hypothetical protein